MNGNDLRILREAAKNIERDHEGMFAAAQDAATSARSLVDLIIAELGDTLSKICGTIHVDGVLVGRGIFVKEHARTPIGSRVAWIDEAGRVRLSLVHDGVAAELPDEDVRRCVFLDPARGAARIALAIVEAISEQGRARLRKIEKMQEQTARIQAVALLLKPHMDHGAAPRDGTDGSDG